MTNRNMDFQSMLDDIDSRCSGSYAPGLAGSGEMVWTCPCGVAGKFGCKLFKEYDENYKKILNGDTK